MTHDVASQLIEVAAWAGLGGGMAGGVFAFVAACAFDWFVWGRRDA